MVVLKKFQMHIPKGESSQELKKVYISGHMTPQELKSKIMEFRYEESALLLHTKGWLIEPKMMGSVSTGRAT